jgi:SPP1 gp7 family putative phage head morphogenesis protein
MDDVLDLFMEYLFKNSEILKSISEENIYNALLNTLQGKTREEILQIAKEKTGEMISNIDLATLEGVRETLKYGLENQLGVDGTARLLKDTVGLNKQQTQTVLKERNRLQKEGKTQEEIDKEIKKLTDTLSRERAKVIAQNEMRKAVQEGEQQVMKERGARFKVWITTQDDLVSDECQGNESEGPIGIDEIFSSGVATPPAHPRCRCSVSFITSDRQLDRAKERAKTRSEKTEQAKS